MNELITFLDDLGLLSYENLENYIWKSKLQYLIDGAIQVRMIVDKIFITKEYTPFSFVPSGDLSGTGGCSEISCKVERANNFSIFSGLYADNVYLTLDFLTSVHFDTSNDETYKYEYNFRYMLWCDFTIILTYCDLINAGIVQIAPTKRNICIDCFQKKLLGLPQPIDLSSLEKYYFEKADLEIHAYYKETDQFTISVKNMDEFFPLHTETISIGEYLLDLLPSNERRTGTTIKNKKFRKAFISNIIQSEFSEVCLYSLCCKNLDSKFITSKPSDGIFIEMTNSANAHSLTIPKINKMPLYDLPIISNASITAILKLREMEQDAFNKYRVALNSAIQEHYNAETPIQIKKVYDDILYPAFQKLDERLHNIKSGMFKKTFSSIMVASSIITAGVYTGIIPYNAIEILKAIGGTSALTGIGVNALNSLTNKSTPLRENDFYFLWKLKNKN